MSDQFVLSTTYGSGPCEGQPQYFRFWTVIGPAATPKLEEAERFESAQAAMESPAYSHWSSFYKPQTLQDAQAMQWFAAAATQAIADGDT